MRKIVRLFASGALALLLALPAEAALAGVQDFYVHNESKWVILFIYVTPDYSDEWEEDVLGDDVLMPGDTYEIFMDDYGDYCYFDILIEDERGNVREYWEVDLCWEMDIYYP